MLLGSRFSRLVHASLAGGSLVLAGCVDRAYDFGDAGFVDPTEGESTYLEGTLPFMQPQLPIPCPF